MAQVQVARRFLHIHGQIDFWMVVSANCSAQPLPGDIRGYLELVPFQVALTMSQPQIVPGMRSSAAGFVQDVIQVALPGCGCRNEISTGVP